MFIISVLICHAFAQEGNYTEINPLATTLFSFSPSIKTPLSTNIAIFARALQPNIGSFSIVYSIPVAAVHVALLPGGTENKMLIIDRNVDFGGMAVNDVRGGKTDTVIWDHSSKGYYGGIYIDVIKFRLTFLVVQNYDPFCSAGAVVPGVGYKVLNIGGWIPSSQYPSGTSSVHMLNYGKPWPPSWVSKKALNQPRWYGS